MNRWLLLLLFTLTGCKSLGEKSPLTALKPPPVDLSADKVLVASNQRNWTPDLSVLPYADVHGDLATVRNIRNFVYQSDDDYVVNYYDKQVDLRDLKSVDFVVVPFKESPTLAHTMLSFGFEGDEYLAVSAEARLEEGENYHPFPGSLRQYELMYVVADERDVILRRTRHRDVDVYVYRTIATPEQSRELFLDVVQRVNQLAEKPEFYNSITNNCTTNIISHLNKLRNKGLPYDARVVLPGFADSLAYELGLLDTQLPFDEARRLARINDAAERVAADPGFSAAIRR